jgi:hypothetical protein
MKHLYFLLFTCISISAAAQYRIHFGYSATFPQQEMAKNIKTLHSMNMGGSYQVPGVFDRLHAGLDLSWGMYANSRKEQTFTFSNGTSTKTFVNYSSNVLQVAATARMFFFKDAVVNPYVSGKTGYASFYSNIFIEDPDDPGGCKALDQKNLIKDGTFMAGYGGGLQIDMSLFAPNCFKRTHYIDISVGKTSGSNINYINTKKLIDASNPPVGTDGKPLTVKFINATTQQIHEHQVAEVYRTPLRMLEFKVRAVFALCNL